MNPEISIVMAYHNRRPQLIRTLQMLDLHPFKDFEVVIVDDASDEEHRLENDLDFSFETTLVRIKPEHKTYKNPCVPFNIGFTYARADKIIIQNPECLHISDLISKTLTIEENKYFSFHCYSFSNALTQQIMNMDFTAGSFADITGVLNNQVNNEFPQISCDDQYAPSWFNHKNIRPVMYHFASAITRKDLKDLGGFDERYANGVGWDDNEFKSRILRKGMAIEFCPETVIHLWHPPHNFHHPDSLDLYAMNENLFFNVTQIETGYQVINRVNSG